MDGTSDRSEDITKGGCCPEDTGFKCGGFIIPKKKKKDSSAVIRDALWHGRSGKVTEGGYSSQILSLKLLLGLSSRGRMVSPLCLRAGCISAVQLLCKVRQAI